MKIKISPDAKAIYLAGIHKWQPINWHWVTVMFLVAGETLEVETNHLFKDQYNTAPLTVTPTMETKISAYLAEYPGRIGEVQKALDSIGGNGLRIMQNVVVEVIDDERPGKARCNWCGKVSNCATVCDHCQKSEYLEVF